MDLPDLANLAVQHGASDLILHENRSPAIRVRGAVEIIDSAPTTPALLSELWSRCDVDPSTRNADAAVILGADHRFRVNLLSQLGQRAAVLRHIRTAVPALDALGLPTELIRTWLQRPNGIILVSGPTGAGKSTTLAACIQFINETSPRHIVSVEDPVEFVFEPAQSVITQRDIGIDTPSFADGLRQALRQAPDVLMIGEIRDSASAVTALQAAETGRLVLATVHGGLVTDALERFSQLLPESERTTLGKVLASQLIGALAQRLVPATDGTQVLAAEFLVNAGATRRFIEEARLRDLADFIQRGDPESARSLTEALATLCRAGQISEDAALATSDNPAELARSLRGISSNSSRR